MTQDEFYTREFLEKIAKMNKLIEKGHVPYCGGGELSELDQRVYNDVVAFLRDLKAKNRSFINLLPTVLVFFNDKPRPSLLENYNPNDPVISFEITLYKKRKSGRIYAYKAEYLNTTLELPEHF